MKNRVTLLIKSLEKLHIRPAATIMIAITTAILACPVIANADGLGVTNINAADAFRSIVKFGVGALGLVGAFLIVMGGVRFILRQFHSGEGGDQIVSAMGLVVGGLTCIVLSSVLNGVDLSWLNG